MKILFCCWELDPFLKFGGLGDVARSLPAALKKIGVDVRIAIPLYRAVALGKCRKTRVKSCRVKYAGKIHLVQVFSVIHPTSGGEVYFLQNRTYLDSVRQDTFAFFNAAVVELVTGSIASWRPDVIHCNDHHTGFIPLLLKERKIPVKTMFTIHNLEYQGKVVIDILGKLGLDASHCRVIQWEIKSRQVNFLMEGVIHADVVTTVSPSYAKEIMTEEYGMGLEEVMRGKEGRVFGILNGIDRDGRERKDGKKGIQISPDRWEGEKKAYKRMLQRKLHLRANTAIPLFSFIGRFAPRQKGIDILHKMLRRADLEEFQIVILGTGNPDWEERFQWLGTFYPKSVSCNFTFDEALAQLMYAASDFILIPSKFEPCGLVQMLAMAYGTIPIAHKTGGLRDSIADGKNGYLFEKYSSEYLEKTVRKALRVWKDERTRHKEMVKEAFNTDVSWTRSAKEYVALYDKLIQNTL